VEREFFDIQEDSSLRVTEISRVAYDQNERPMRLTITVYVAERNTFVIDVGQVPPVEAAQFFL
jgi:DNA-binding GntR family transcriptional regulator